MLVNSRATEQAKINAACLEQIKGKVSLLGALNEGQILTLLSYMEKRVVHAGEKVFNQDDLPSEIFIVSSGRIHSTIARQDGSFTSLDYLPGDCFGETALIGIQPQMGDAVALGEVELLTLSKTALMDLLEDDDTLFGVLMMNIAREVSRRFQHAMLAPNDAIEHAVSVTH